jgi:hypothetical protein
VVNVTGTPTLQLNDNEVATYATGSGTNALTFTYTVQTSDNVADLQVTGLNLPSGATIQDAAGNDLSGGVTGDLGIQIDTTAPSAPSITAVTDNVAPVTGTLHSGDYTNDPDPIVPVSLSGTNALAGDTVQLYNGTSTGSPLGSPYTLTSTDIGNGFANVQPRTLTNGTTYTLTARITDAAGNQSAASTNSFTLTEDTTLPRVQSFTASDPSVTNANVVHYALTFSEPVTGVNTSDFSLITTGVSGANITSVTPISGSNGEQYAVTVNTGTGSGTVAVELSEAGIQDLAGNPLPGGTFYPQTTYPVGSYAIYVAIGDVNNDGKLDLVVANYLDNTVSVLLGNGDGTFQARTTYATGHNPDSVAIGDVNGDGKPDLVVSNQSKNDQGLLTVSVLLGNGDGTFQSQISSTADASAFSVAIGDVNGDGKPDVVVPNIWSNTLSVLLGNGDGTFRSPIINLTGVSPFAVAIGDVNGDGKPDLVASNESEKTLSVLLGNGDGTFQAQTTYATGLSPSSVAIGDVNGDGSLDIVVANGGSVC